MTGDVRSTWANLEELILDPVVDFVQHYSSQMPTETDWSSSLGGSWYLSPKQHVIEFVIFNVIFALCVRFYIGRILAKGSPQETSLRKFVPPKSASIAEYLILAATIGSLGLTAVHKYHRDALVFLLQPCHVSATILIIVMLLPKTSKVPHFLFNIYLHILWGTMLALVFPDMRDYDMLFEVANFYIEHWLLLVVPAYLFYARRVDIWAPSLDVALAAYFLKCLYHSLVLSGFALLSGANLNYILSPPPISIFHDIGIWYRAFMYLASFLLTFSARYVVVELALRLIPQAKKDRSE